MYEIEILDVNGRRRPGAWMRLFHLFPEVFKSVAQQGETRTIAVGLKQFTIRPIIGDTLAYDIMYMQKVIHEPF